MQARSPQPRATPRRPDRGVAAGGVVASWLLDLTAEALVVSPDLGEFAGHVSDSGEGRWTSIAAIDEGVPAPVLTASLYSRFASRGLNGFANKVLSASARASAATTRNRLEAAPGRRRAVLHRRIPTDIEFTA
jgi:6-phosphogluconate dehydrogenase